jgi:ribosome assembly protein 1
MLYPDLYETAIEPKNKLEEDLYASKSGPKASVVAYVSKMFAASVKDLPENKKKTLTAAQMREKFGEMRAARQLDAEAKTDSEGGGMNYTPDIRQTEVAETANADAEVLLGFARLYSGTISVGTSIYAVLPKYKVLLGPAHPINSKYLLTVKVEGLYIMMGRELVPVLRVRAGNIFAIKGLESKVWRSATLCGPEEVGIGDNPDPEVNGECLINLGSINRAVRLDFVFQP